MSDKVKIQYVSAAVGKPGETESVDADRARLLIRAGAAVPATVPEAKKAGVDPEGAATKRD